MNIWALLFLLLSYVLIDVCDVHGKDILREQRRLRIQNIEKNRKQFLQDLRKMTPRERQAAIAQRREEIFDRRYNRIKRILQDMPQVVPEDRLEMLTYFRTVYRDHLGEQEKVRKERFDYFETIVKDERLATWQKKALLEEFIHKQEGVRE